MESLSEMQACLITRKLQWAFYLLMAYYGPGPSIITLALICNHLKFRILMTDDTQRKMLIDSSYSLCNVLAIISFHK